jgi:pimeloyl-ACP methyl ester carboxylesterase
VWGAALSEALHHGMDRGLLPMLWRAMFLPQIMPDEMGSRFPFALAGEAEATVRIGEDCLAAGLDLLTLLTMAPALATPLVVLGGAKDVVINNRLHGQVLATLAPSARFCLLPEVGHMIHHVAPESVAQAVEDVWRYPSPRS